MSSVGDLIKANKRYKRFCYRSPVDKTDSFESARVKFVLSSLAPYDVYQFSLGQDIVTSLLAREPGIYVDHAVWLDYKLAKMLRVNKSFYSQRHLREFDFIGLGIYYMFQFFTAPQLIMQAGLNPFAKNRHDKDPVIIAGGGQMVTNPEAVADFMDIIYMGDAEVNLLNIVKRRKDFKTKRDFLEAINSDYRCVYCPQLKPKKVVKANTEKIHLLKGDDFISKGLNKPIELIRGCNYKCNFCNLGWTRKKALTADFSSIKSAIESHPENAIIYPFAPDEASYTKYNKIAGILGGRRMFRYNQRIDRFSKVIQDQNPEDMQMITTPVVVHGIDGISDRLRQIVNKRITNEQIEKCLEFDFKIYREVKLNIVFCYPGENNQDWDEFEEWLEWVCKIRRRVNPNAALSEKEIAILSDGGWSRNRAKLEKIKEYKKLCMIHLAVTPFNPQPHTPMQWFGQSYNEAQRDRFNRVCRKVREKYSFIKIEGMNGVGTQLASILLNRADRKYSKLIIKTLKKTKAGNYTVMARRFVEECVTSGIKVRDQVGLMTTDCSLPWDFIDVGFKKSTLIKKYETMRDKLYG